MDFSGGKRSHTDPNNWEIPEKFGLFFGIEIQE
jgi:hypothetical protein